MAEAGTYLYAISRGIRLEQLTRPVGMRGGALRLVDHEELRAVVSTVDLDEFGEAALRRNLEDLGWVEDVARTHDAVVTDIARFAPTAPLRLVTIYFDDESVRGRLRERHDELVASLDRVDGRSEWGVKVYAAAAGSEPAEAQSEESGTAYLARRRAERDQRSRDLVAAQGRGDRIHERLCELVVASRRLAPQDPRLSGRREPMILNGTYLVDDERTDRLRGLIAALTDEYADARIELSGPWPPYSFATLEES